MSKPITKIQISGFRGAIKPFELDFDPKKNFTMLFGENGSGKSSILDALDVVCSGTNGSLDSISVGSNPGKFLCALGCQPATLKITIHSNDDNWTGAMQRNAINVVGTGVKPKVKILRRKAILDLVLAQPSKRYEALRSFIEISGIEQSENTLRQKLTEIERDITTAASDKARMTAQLDNLWNTEGRPGHSQAALAWAEEKIALGIGGLKDHLDRLKAATAAITEVATAKANLNKRNEALNDANKELSSVEQQIAAAPSIDSATAIQLLESLEKAKTYVEADAALDKCPTCLRPIGREALLSTIDTELSQLKELKTLSDNRKQIQEKIKSMISLVNDAVTSVVKALKNVHEATRVGGIPEIASLAIARPSWQDTIQDTLSLIAFCDQFQEIQTSLEHQRDSAQRDVSQFNSVKEWWSGIKEVNDKAADLIRIKNGLKNTLDIVHDKRVTFTQGILDGIQQEANRLFQTIHPGENLGLEQLKMVEDRRSSIDQTGVFYGHAGIPPQAVFSESHLDTLGFCVWLSLAKREAPTDTTLLIDDIFSSVDATHLSRVIDLISAEAQNFLRIVVATHYRFWWDRCKNAQGIQRVHLGRWCATNGIAAQNMPRVLDELQAKIAEPVLDRQAVASKAGILLESILDDLALLYECALPYNKSNLYTLGALQDACKKLFSKHNLTVQIDTNWNVDSQPENWQATIAKTAYERINNLQFIRNQVGCHFNISGMEIPDNDVRDFGFATIALVEALICPNCGMLPTKKTNHGTHLQCSCAKKAARMTPVDIS